MSSLQVSVTEGSENTSRLPDWGSQFVVLVGVLRKRGWLTIISDALRVQREGGYVGLDAFLYLLGMFCWARPDRRKRSIKAFSEACSFSRGLLAAVGDRLHWPTQSAISRLLCAVPVGAMLKEAGAKMLSLGVESLISHPDAQCRDATGEGWHIADGDITVLGVRERGLPEGEDLPPAQRRVGPDLAGPGYGGRHRGELFASLGALMHAGSGLWVQLTAVPGKGKFGEVLAELVDAIPIWLRGAQASAARALVRADGAARSVASLHVFAQAGLHYLVRMACYEFLQRPEVQAHLQGAAWHLVPDSGSGPVREAAELGIWPWRGLPMPEGAPQGLGEARIVVTRFPAKAKHGAGIFLDGMQYELFGTSVNATVWPAPELVWLYFARAGLENRFAQIKAELGIDRLFCYELGGQWLATLVGLLVWNLRTILGAERAGMAPGMPQLPARRQPAQVASSKPESPPAQTANVSPLAELNARLNTLDWAKHLADRPDWQWHVDHGLRCPAGKDVLPQSLQKSGKILAYRTRGGDCAYCPKKLDCFGDHQQRDRDRLILNIGVAKLQLPADQTAAAIRQARTQSLPGPWLPPPPAEPGPYAANMPLLLPAELRAGWHRALHGASAHIEVHRAPPPKRPAWRADSAAQRQHRRLTWAERLTRNALPAGSKVCAHLAVRDRWLGELLREAA